MTENDVFPPVGHERSLLSKLLLLLGLCLLGTFAFMLVGMIAGTATSKLSLTDLMEGINNPQGQGMWYFMVIITGFSHLGGFWLAGLAYLNWVEKANFESLNKVPIKPILLLVAFAMIFCFLPVSEFFVNLNQKMQLPSGLQNWMQEMEDNATNLTKFLMDFTGFGQLVIVFIVIAIFAGVGEELVFRGILQNLIQKSTANHHVAIWVSAIIFSAIHMQFFGFLPRMLLGALFGYLYVWSGNIWVPIVAHIANNGIVVLAMYLHNIGVIETDVSTAETPLSLTAIAAVLCAGFIFYFFRNRINISTNE